MKNSCVLLIGFLLLVCGCAQRQQGDYRGVWKTDCSKVSGGNIVIDASDSIELEIAPNQMYIKGVVRMDTLKNCFNIYYARPLDVGRGGMEMHWSHFSSAVPVGYIYKITDSSMVFKWMGLFDSVEGMRSWENGLAWLGDASADSGGIVFYRSK